MLKTIVILLLTLVVVPISAYYFDSPLDSVQLEVLKNTAALMLLVAIACFIIGELSGNNSQVDKIWSILPIIYVWQFARASEFDPRIIVMAVLTTFWGVRLTYNFARRGAYSIKFWEGEEDYRWAELRKMPLFNKRWKWSLFNFGFICLYQNTLILLFTLPALVAMKGTAHKMDWFDLVLILFFLVALYVETRADQQQFDFHTTKNRVKNAGLNLPVRYQRGFTWEGLWAKVRHPNYTAEQSIWLIFYLFSVSATGQWINWSITGFLLLLLLFQGSSDFSESISAQKYPEYKEYQKQVPRFLPKLFSK